MNESTIFSEGHIKRFALQKLWSLIRYLEPSYPPFLEGIMSKSLTMKIADSRFLSSLPHTTLTYLFCITVLLYFCLNIFMHFTFYSDSSSSWWKLLIATQGQEWSAVILTCCHFFTYPVILHEKVVYLVFFLLSGFALKSFLTVGIPEGLIIRIADQCLQDLWHQLLKQNHRLSFHHPSLIRWVKLHVTKLLMINILRHWHLLFWSCLLHPATPPFINNYSNILPVLLYGADVLEDHPEGLLETIAIQASILHACGRSAEFIDPKRSALRRSISRQVTETSLQ